MHAKRWPVWQGVTQVTCESIKDLILFYPGSQLGPADRQQVVSHTVACARCRSELVATLAAARQVRATVKRLPEPPLPRFAALPLQITSLPQEDALVRPLPAAEAKDVHGQRFGLQVLRLILPAVASLVENPLGVLPAPVAAWLPDQA